MRTSVELTNNQGDVTRVDDFMKWKELGPACMQIDLTEEKELNDEIDNISYELNNKPKGFINFLKRLFRYVEVE